MNSNFGGGNSGSSSPKRAGSGQGDWVCAVCHKFNYAKRTTCFSCETARGATADGQPTLSEITPVGDSNWRCHICSSLNFRSRASCWQCQTSRLENFGMDEIQIEEHEGSAPAIKKEGFQVEAEGKGDAKSIAKQEDQRKLEKRRKALEHAAGWSGTGQFSSQNRNSVAGKGVFHPPGSASIGGSGGEDDDENSDWLCAKCMRKNNAGTTECGRCFSPKSVAPGSRALTALAANKVKKIHKL